MRQPSGSVGCMRVTPLMKPGKSDSCLHLQQMPMSSAKIRRGATTVRFELPGWPPRRKAANSNGYAKEHSAAPGNRRLEMVRFSVRAAGYDGCGSPRMQRTVSRAISSSSFVGMTQACSLDPSVLMRPSPPPSAGFDSDLLSGQPTRGPRRRGHGFPANARQCRQ